MSDQKVAQEVAARLSAAIVSGVPGTLQEKESTVNASAKLAVDCYVAVLKELNARQPSDAGGFIA